MPVVLQPGRKVVYGRSPMEEDLLLPVENFLTYVRVAFLRIFARIVLTTGVGLPG